MTRPIPFDLSNQMRSDVRRSLAKKLQDLQEFGVRQFVSVRNLLHLTHGTKWSQPANEFGSGGGLQSISAEFLIPFERIVAHDLGLIDESVRSIFEKLDNDQSTAFYQLISDTCDRSGNVVNAKEQGLAASYLAAMEKIEFSVSESGEVEPPHIHTGNASAFAAEIERQPPEYRQALQDVIERKKAEAIEREKARKARFKKAEP